MSYISSLWEEKGRSHESLNNVNIKGNLLGKESFIWGNLFMGLVFWFCFLRTYIRGTNTILVFRTCAKEKGKARQKQKAERCIPAIKKSMKNDAKKKKPDVLQRATTYDLDCDPLGMFALFFSFILWYIFKWAPHCLIVYSVCSTGFLTYTALKFSFFSLVKRRNCDHL